MWLTSVYLKTLRDARVAILGWGAGMGLLLYVVLSAVPSLMSTPEAKASLVSLAGSYAWLADPVAVDTPGGYATFKYGFMILLVAIWPLMVCSRLLRGEEERGIMDTLLSLPRSRWRVALEKLAAVWTALLCIAVLIGLLAFAGGARVNADFGMGGALLFGVNVAVCCGVFGSLALLISQFTQERRVAAGLTGALLLIFIVLDMLHRVIPNTEWISRFSPVYYYNLSKPLIPSVGTNFGALLVLVALNVLLSGAALIIFARRDVGGTAGWKRTTGRVTNPERVVPVNAWSLRSIYARGLGMVAVPACWWTLGIAGFASWMVVIAKQTETQLTTLAQSSPLLQSVFSKVGGSDVTTNATILSAIYVLLPLLMMAFAVTQTNHWAADEEDGLHDLVLSTPQSRLRLLLARFGALATASIFIGVVTLGTTMLASLATGLKLDQGNLAAATLSIIPLGLLMAALGYLFAGWLSTALETGLLSFLLVIWFFISFVGPELNWSDTTLRLSAFYYYGTPLLHGLPVWDTVGVLAVAIAILVLASVRFVRKDIGR